MTNPTTQLINHLLTDKGDKGLANGCATASKLAGPPRCALRWQTGGEKVCHISQGDEK